MLEGMGDEYDDSDTESEGKEVVIRDWDSIQGYFALKANECTKDLLLNLKNMELPGLEKYVGPSLTLDKQVYYKNDKFMIDITIYNNEIGKEKDWQHQQIGTQIRVLPYNGKFYVRIGELISYRYSREYDCPLNHSEVFCAESSNLDDLKYIPTSKEKLPESYKTFKNFANLTAKKLAFAYVIYRMCKKTDIFTWISDWVDNVTIVNQTPEMLELKVKVINTKEYLKNSCYIKAVFSLDDHDHIANIKSYEFYTVFNLTPKDEDHVIENIDDFLNLIRQKKTLNSLLMIEQKLDMISFAAI